MDFMKFFLTSAVLFFSLGNSCCFGKTLKSILCNKQVYSDLALKEITGAACLPFTHIRILVKFFQAKLKEDTKYQTKISH